MMAASGSSATRAAFGLAVVCLGTLVAPLDSAVNISLPSISNAFDRGIEDIRWIVIAYVLTYSSLLLICGKLGDLYGYRRVFQLGLVVSAAGFGCCALAPTFPLLLVGRVLQGIGIALTLSCAPALATTLYDESQRTRVIGIYAALTAVGAALGPVVGGLLIEVFGWRVVFWMRAPIAIAALALSWTIPNRQRSEAIGGFDFVGAGLLVVWLVTLLLALALRTEMAGFEVRLMLLGVAGVTFGVWLRHERRHPEPIIRPALFRDVGFTFVNVVSVIVNYAAFSILLLVPYFLVRTAGLSAGAGGAVLALAAVGTVIGAWLAGRLAGGIATTKLVAVGLLLSLAGLTGIAHWTAATALGHIGLALLVQGLGVGLFNVAYTDLVTATLPLRDRGVAGSLTMVTRTLGVVAGATLHAQIQQVSQSAAQLAGATAEQAFVAGFQAAFVAAALVLAGGLMLCVVQLARSGVGARTL